MRQDLGVRIHGALLAAVLVAASSLLMAAPALAQTKQALAFVQRGFGCCNAGGMIPSAYSVGYVLATVGSGTSTPSVYIASNQVGSVLTTTWTGPLTPFSINEIDRYNVAVTFKRSHSLAPTATTTVRASLNTSTPVGGTFYMPRYGTMIQTPGPNRFGGTMAVVSNLHAYGQYVASVGYYSFYFNANATPNLTGGPYTVGKNGRAMTGMLTHTSITYKGRPLAFDAPIFITVMPSTTGTQYLYQPFGYYVTQYTETGYDNRTPSGLSGTLSLVRPMLVQYYGVYEPPRQIAWNETQGMFYRTTITFLPEPGSLLMLGCGILTVAGLYRLRMR